MKRLICILALALVTGACGNNNKDANGNTVQSDDASKDNVELTQGSDLTFAMVPTIDSSVAPGFFMAALVCVTTVLMTGWLGGAVATHVQKGELLLIAPVIFGIVVWLGLFLRDRRVRALLPLRT